MRFGTIFCQNLLGEQRDLLEYSVKKLWFLHHNRNPNSSVSPGFVSSIRVMPIAASFGLVSGWVDPKATLSWPEKQKSEGTAGVIWWRSQGGFSAGTFVEEFETEVSKPEKTARALCWFQHFTTGEADVNPNVLVQGRHFPLRFAVMQHSGAELNRFEGSVLSRKGQICHTLSHQLALQLRFFKKSFCLTVLPWGAAFNYLLLLWLYACF